MRLKYEPSSKSAGSRLIFSSFTTGPQDQRSGSTEVGSERVCSRTPVIERLKTPQIAGRRLISFHNGPSSGPACGWKTKAQVRLVPKGCVFAPVRTANGPSKRPCPGAPPPSRRRTPISCPAPRPPFRTNYQFRTYYHSEKNVREIQNKISFRTHYLRNSEQSIIQNKLSEKLPETNDLIAQINQPPGFKPAKSIFQGPPMTKPRSTGVRARMRRALPGETKLESAAHPHTKDRAGSHERLSTTA